MTTEITQSLVDEVRTLRQRVLRAGGWSIAGFALAQVIRFGTNLVMTRLLVPEMFGVMAIAHTVLIGLVLFSDLGLRLNVIQSRRGNDPVFLNTAWVTQILVGSLLALGAVVVASLLALANHLGLLPPESAYAAPVLPYVIAALGSTLLLAGFESTRSAESSRRLALGRLIQVQLAAQVAAVVAMLALAAMSRSIWVLVVGALVSAATGTLLTHLWLPGTPNRVQWDWKAFREILGFGRWILVSSMVGFLASAGDKVIFGWMVSASLLGLYSIAGLLLSAVEQVLGALIGEVAFPALSEVARERRVDLKRMLYKFHRPLAALAYMAAGLLAVAGGAIVRLLYDVRYHDAGWMLQILAGMLLAVPCQIHGQCFLALGISRWVSNLAILRLVVLAGALPIGFHLFGIAGAIFGVVLSYLSAIPATLYYAAKCSLVDVKKELVPILAVIPGALIGVGIVLVLSR
jgi:O-antigen/teichoic acid export membrane protein